MQISQILKREIHFPEKMRLEVSQLLDYPPRLLIYAQHPPQLSPSMGNSISSQSLPELQVIGLDMEYTLPLFGKLAIS